MLWFAHVGFEPTSGLDPDTLPDTLIDPLIDALPVAGDVQPTLSGPAPGQPWTVSFCVDADTLKAATALAHTTFARAIHDGLPGVKVRTRFLELVDEPEFDRRLAQPVVPDLVGIAEIAEQLGVSKPRARELVAAGRIRKVASLAAGPVCLARDLAAYEATPRKAGRPRKS